MVGSGSPLLAESSLSPTSPPASAIRSSRSKARSRDWTPPVADLAESVVLALDVGTARSFRGWREERSVPGTRLTTGLYVATFCLLEF